MPRRSAAQVLSRIALEKSLELTEWPSDMHGQILPAQLKLHEAIVQRRITDVRGRKGAPGSEEQRLTDLFSDAKFMGFTLLVTPYGTLTVHPPHKRREFEEKYGIDDLDKWWRGINFDQDESEQAFSAPLAPRQGQPHLRLVSGGRSGETEAPALTKKTKKAKKAKKTKKTKKTKNRIRRRGPKPGEVKRYGSADRKLFPEIQRRMRKEHLTPGEAAQKLADEGHVAGKGTKESCARRLARLYKAERLRTQKPHRQ